MELDTIGKRNDNGHGGNRRNNTSKRFFLLQLWQTGPFRTRLQVARHEQSLPTNQYDHDEWTPGKHQRMGSHRTRHQPPGNSRQPLGDNHKSGQWPQAGEHMPNMWTNHALRSTRHNSQLRSLETSATRTNHRRWLVNMDHASTPNPQKQEKEKEGSSP